MMFGGHQTHVTTSAGIPKALFSGVSSSASSSSSPSQRPPLIVVPAQRSKVVAPVLEEKEGEEEVVPAATPYLPQVEDLLAQDGLSSQETVGPVGAL